MLSLTTAIAATRSVLLLWQNPLMSQSSASVLPKRGYPASSRSIPEFAAHMIVCRAQRKHDRAASKRL